MSNNVYHYEQYLPAFLTGFAVTAVGLAIRRFLDRPKELRANRAQALQSTVDAETQRLTESLAAANAEHELLEDQFDELREEVTEDDRT